MRRPADGYIVGKNGSENIESLREEENSMCCSPRVKHSLKGERSKRISLSVCECLALDGNGIFKLPPKQLAWRRERPDVDLSHLAILDNEGDHWSGAKSRDNFVGFQFAIVDSTGKVWRGRRSRCWLWR